MLPSPGGSKRIIRKLPLAGQSTTITLKSGSVKELTENFEGKSDETTKENPNPDIKNPDQEKHKNYNNSPENHIEEDDIMDQDNSNSEVKESTSSKYEEEEVFKKRRLNLRKRKVMIYRISLIKSTANSQNFIILRQIRTK